MKTHSDFIQRLVEVKARTGLSRSTIYLLCKQNKFPRPIQLGLRAVGWRASDISTWIEERATTSEGGAK